MNVSNPWKCEDSAIKDIDTVEKSLRASIVDPLMAAEETDESVKYIPGTLMMHCSITICPAILSNVPPKPLLSMLVRRIRVIGPLKSRKEDIGPFISKFDESTKILSAISVRLLETMFIPTMVA